MSKKNEWTSEAVSRTTADSRATGRRFRRVLALIQIGLVALLTQAPAFATDPTDADPDPDYSSSSTTTTLVFYGMDEVDVSGLPPGHYVIIVIDENGASHTFKIYVS